ncbi:MAG: site-2 protease family protein [Spirochaetota bacterium]
MILNILIGLIGLGIVILVHETGHFVAAKLCGIDVEAFSLGWGKKLISFKKNKTEYRLSLIPLGGYCKMKGDDLLKKAWQANADTIPYEEGSFFSVSPWKRILVAVSGPFSNLVFAVVILSLLWWVGFNIRTFENKIILASEYAQFGGKASYPADRAGLKTGDIIIAINGRQVNHYRDIQEAITPSAGKELSVRVLREDKELAVTLSPELDKETGIGRIGVFAWIDPVIGFIQAGSSAAVAGLKPGDRLTALNDRPVENTVDFYSAFLSKPQKVDMTFERKGIRQAVTLIADYTEKGDPDLGLSFATRLFRSPNLNFFQAVEKGFQETINTLDLSFKSIALLFKGVNLREAVSGPIRLTYYVGEVATQGFKMGISDGFTNSFQFLSLISVALFIMNLLPIPVLDGGLFLLFLFQGITHKELKPKIIFRYQSIGLLIIVTIALFTAFNDIFFLVKR